MRLSFVAVTTDNQFIQLLVVRNECRDGMTHNPNELTLEDQKKFRELCWPPIAIGPREMRQTTLGESLWWYEPYLLYDDEWPIGYGLLKWDGERYWMTAGLSKGYRGKGLSRFLINYITDMGHREGKEVVLDAYDGNRGMVGYIREGYEVIGMDYPEIWIDVSLDNPALIGDIKVGYEVETMTNTPEGKKVYIMKHNRDRQLREAERLILKEIKNPKIDIIEEMIEVDRISRKGREISSCNSSL